MKTSSYGFTSTSNRLRLGELIADKSGKMLIIPLACAFGAETAEREKNCAAMAGFKKENIYIFDRRKPDELLGMNFRYMPELEWRFGYPVVIVVSIIIAVACLLFFKRKKWL